MTPGRILDLDHLEPAALEQLGIVELERILAAVERLTAVRRVDPELREAVLRRIEEAVASGRISQERAAEIRVELDQAHPAAVLAAHRWEILDPHMPTLGAFPRAAVDTDKWYRDDPRRLVAYMREVSRFTHNEERILKAAADFAEQVGIPDRVAEEMLADGLRAVRAAWREKGAGRAS